MRGAGRLGFLAIALAGVALMGGRVEAPRVAVLTTTSSDDTFTISSSRDGSAIFTAANLAPGHSAGGSVTIGNGGTLPGTFTLSQLDLADEPGPGGGQLSTRLHLTVVDVTAPSAPTMVYSGPLAALDTRALGFFAPGQSRTYGFTATLERGGTDNAFVGSTASVRYRWTGESLPARTPPPDARPPLGLRLRVPADQRLLTRGVLIAYVRCDAPCHLRLWGWVDDPLGSSRFLHGYRGVALASGRRTKLLLRLPWAPGNLLERALRGGGEGSVRVRADASDPMGRSASVTRAVPISGSRSP